jgi:hypothetical protein
MKKIITVVGIFLTLAASSQKANFSGSWAINKGKVEWKDTPEYVLPKSFKIEQSNDQVIIGRVLLDANLEEHPFSETLPFSGVEVTNETYAGVQRTTSLKWNEDRLGFVLSTTNSNSNMAIGEIKETWALINDGKILVIERMVKQADGFEYSVKGYYDRK